MELTQKLQELNTNLNLSKVVNNALDIGLKAILPDVIEDEVIQIKDAFIQNGFVAGLEEAKQKVEEVYKSIKGLFTGEFDSLGEIKKLLQKNGILDTASTLIDKITKTLSDKKIINKSVSNLIKEGKKIILNALEGELKSYYKIDDYDLEKLQTQIDEWKESYKNNDIKTMEKIAKQITGTLQKNEKIEKVLTQAQNIEKAQNFIDQKGGIENITESEKQILEQLELK